MFLKILYTSILYERLQTLCILDFFNFNSNSLSLLSEQSQAKSFLNIRHSQLCQYVPHDAVTTKSIDEFYVIWTQGLLN